ncbi:TIM barrel protein [Caldiplasma sukawensis]
MIRYGIAGIPLTSKGRTLIDSITDSFKLGLRALEVQLLRVNVQESPGIDYEGMMPRENENSIIVDVQRPNEEGEYESVGINTVIQEDDTVQEIFWNLAKNYEELKFASELAKELDIQLSIHSPYYMDMLNGEEMREISLNHLKWTMEIGKAMGAKRVITHTGFYPEGKKNPVKVAENVYSDFIKNNKIDETYPYIGVETSGKPEIFGTADEVLSLSKKINMIEPILNLPHYHSRENGKLIDVSSFNEIINMFSEYSKGDVYLEFAGVEYGDSRERKLTAIKHGDLKFETMAEALMSREEDFTIISCSPLLEHDAQYMEVIFARNYSRHVQRKKK